MTQSKGPPDWVYLNGEFVRHDAAKISVFDRSVLFADSVYEVTSVINAKLIDFEEHIARLGRSCAALGIDMPLDLAAWRTAHEDLIKRNDIKEGLVYLQVSGGDMTGVGKRDFQINRTVPPTFFMFTQSKAIIDNPLVKRGMKIVTVEDQRWARRDIKTTQLLSQSLARTQAIKAGYDDAWFVSNGLVNEGASSNAFIVTHEGVIRTRPSSQAILSGITREAVMACIDSYDLKFEAKPFSRQEALDAREAFSTSATSFVMPVIEIDGHKIGSGKPGEVTLALRQYYMDHVRA